MRKPFSTAIAMWAIVGFSQQALAWTAPVNISNMPSGSRAVVPKAAADSSSNVHCVWFGGVDPN